MRLIRSLAILFILAITVRDARAGTVAPAYPSQYRSRQAPLPASSAKLNLYQRASVSNYLRGQVRPISSLRVLAVQVQFADTLMGGQPGSLRSELRDSTYFANEIKHLEQYYSGASRKNLLITWRVTPKLYTLPLDMGYYGDELIQDERVVEMMQSVIDSADADEDFSLYDTIILIHAGAGQETDVLGNSPEQIFSVFMDRNDIAAAFPDSIVLGLATADSLGGQPFLIDNFMVLSAASSQDDLTLGSLGVWAFITGSRLGLVPLFDSQPAGFPDSRGVGDFDLMSNGLFNAFIFVPGFPSAFNRILAGWLDPVVVDTDGQFRLHDVNTPAPFDTACLRIPITESEYFLVVNRVHDTNFDSLFTFSDRDSSHTVALLGLRRYLIPDNADSLGGGEFDFWLTDISDPFVEKPDPGIGGLVRRFMTTGSGLYVWHVDESVIRQNIDIGFLPNDFVTRKGVDLEEADGIRDLDITGSGLSFGSHFDSFRAGHNDTFGPDTNPSSTANSGARTGVTIGSISAAGSFMTCDIVFTRPYAEQRVRWLDSGTFQPPTAFDLDATGDIEIVAFADAGRVYAFNADGTEFVDKDLDPSTIEPFFSAPGAVWRGAPAFGDIDGVAGDEIIAFSVEGTVYAWKGDSTEVFDGDLNPATNGVLYVGAPLAAPPMLVDVAGDARNEIAIVESVGDFLLVGFLDDLGAKVIPTAPLDTLRIQAQFCAPLAFGRVEQLGAPGIVVAWADTIRGVYGITLSGFGQALETVTFAPLGVLQAAFPPVSAPATGDLNGDGYDEVVLTLPDGRLVIHTLSPSGFGQAWSIGGEPAATPPAAAKRTEVITLRSTNPSSPALGDVDGDGALEIALWDNDHFYLFENNGRLATNWPQPLRQIEVGSFPPLAFDARLNSPLIGHVDGDSQMDILFPTREGTVYGYHGDGSLVAGFPRVGPAAMGATPVVADLDGDGELQLVSLGSVPLLQTFDAVSDTIITREQMVLSLQTLPGSSALDASFWFAYQHDALRRGRVTEPHPLRTASGVVQQNSFIIYPNPVRGDLLHARIVINRSATIQVEIYNLEGERALSQGFLANPSGTITVRNDAKRMCRNRDISSSSHLKTAKVLTKMSDPLELSTDRRIR